MIRHLFTVVALAVPICAGPACAQQPEPRELQPKEARRHSSRAAQNHSVVVFPGEDGKLRYKPDEQGNTLPDFSNCGYMGGGVRIPDAPVRATLKPDPRSADDTARIQKAIDDVAQLQPDRAGLRGAVLLTRGRYRVNGQLKMNRGGVVLRGEGDNDNGTVLVAGGKDRRALIAIAGTSAPQELDATRVKVTDEIVPVGARSFNVDDASNLKPGDTVFVARAGNDAWISAIGMDRIAGRPGNEDSTKQWGPFVLRFDRVITAVEGSKVTVDGPIVCAIEQRWGGGTVTKYDDVGRIEQFGVENLRAVSEIDKSITEQRNDRPYLADEDHAEYLVSFDNVKNGWLRRATTRFFAHGPALVRNGAKWVTVEDCRSLEPVSRIDGGRRYPYAYQGGQLILTQRCFSDGARHAFVVGSRVCGPNAFVDCTSERDYATSEPHHRWSVGGLYDNVNSKIAFQDRQYMGSGHGWAGANYVAWNCRGTLVCQKPPTAQNWAIGFVGEREPGAFEREPGHWESHGKHVVPRSLYYKQLEDRLGKGAVANVSGKDR